jgi:outer membrane protein OmpA-like peptidoglycan-associated protein
LSERYSRSQLAHHTTTESVMPAASSHKVRITFGTHWRASQIALIAAGVGLSACAMLNKKEQGAIVGAGVGGAVGAVVGNQVGSTAKGAIVGAVVGGVAGTIIGHQMDQQAKELKQNIAGATVERVGEGIQVTFASGLLYDIDSDHIRFEAADNLRTLAASLGKYPNTDLLIVGHTDSTGTSAYNQGLSERRAQAASDFLVTQGVTSGRLRTSGRGENEPVATNSTDAGRQLNRRVEIAIFANAAARTAGGK